MNILKRGGLACTRRSHQHDKAMVQLSSLANSSYDAIGEWLRHYRSPPEPGVFARVSSHQWSMEPFRVSGLIGRNPKKLYTEFGKDSEIGPSDQSG
jgi:hypothetical protein